MDTVVALRICILSSGKGREPSLSPSFFSYYAHFHPCRAWFKESLPKTPQFSVYLDAEPGGADLRFGGYISFSISHISAGKLSSLLYAETTPRNSSR